MKTKVGLMILALVFLASNPMLAAGIGETQALGEGQACVQQPVAFPGGGFMSSNSQEGVERRPFQAGVKAGGMLLDSECEWCYPDCVCPAKCQLVAGCPACTYYFWSFCMIFQCHGIPC